MTTRIIVGDCRERMAELPAGSVHCVVTSPPYFGLRDYGHAGQIGLEPTPDAFVAAMVEVMRGVWRVLRDDGVAWVVLGDSFANDAKWGGATGGKHADGLHGATGIGRGKRDTGSAPGNLLLIPARVALALQQDGWTLRQMVTWAKPAPMPESVAGTRWERCRVKVSGAGATRAKTPWAAEQAQSNGLTRAGREGRTQATVTTAECPGCPKCEANDGFVLRKGSWRHTSATEQVLMLTKGMSYWADQEAVREAAAYPDDRRKPFAPGQVDNRGNGHDRGGGSERTTGTAGRNPRNWTSPPPSPFSGAHFATYPPKLIEPFIRATCPAKCCPACGAGWAVVVGREAAIPQRDNWKQQVDPQRNDTDRAGGFYPPSTVLGYRPTCACPPAAPVPGVCLDPFAGAGTTLLVADRLRRDAIGIELNPNYARIIETRIRADAGMFAEISA